MNKTITVFGSSQPKPGDKEYETAYKLGKMLGEKGFNVCSGGYMGIMDAVSKGAIEKGANAIGVTISGVPSAKSKHLTENVETQSLFDRIDKLLRIGNGYVILEGGTGTMLELSAVWEFANKRFQTVKPIACHGKMWKSIIQEMDNRMKFEGRETGLVKHYVNIGDCANYVMNYFSGK
jgi:hypothetical protein